MRRGAALALVLACGALSTERAAAVFGDPQTPQGEDPVWMEDQAKPQGACGAPPAIVDSGVPGYAWDDPSIGEKRHTSQAIEFANNNDLDRALKSFQAATRANKTPDTLTNLGVTYMRLRSFRAAMEAITSAKKIAPPGTAGHAHVKSNWQDLMQTMVALETNIPAEFVDGDPWKKHGVKYAFIGKEKLDKFVTGRKTPKRPKLRHQRPVPVWPSLPRVSIQQIDGDDERFEPYRSRQQPFILTGAMEGWPTAGGHVHDLKKLAKVFPDAVTDFYPFNMLSKDKQSPYLTRLPAAVEEVVVKGTSTRFGRDNTAGGEQGAYMHLQLTPGMWRKLEQLKEVEPAASRHWHLQGDAWQAECLQREDLISEYNLKTHWMIILAGARGAGMFNHSDSLRTSSWHGHVRGRKWWYLCNNGKCFESYLEVGEVLYYGDGWSHETQNLVTPSITITGTVVHEHNFKKVAEMLQEHCVGASHDFKFSAELCDALDTCKDWWWHTHAKSSRPSAHLPAWRTVANAQEIHEKEARKPADNNYDGRNYITEL